MSDKWNIELGLACLLDAIEQPEAEIEPADEVIEIAAWLAHASSMLNEPSIIYAA